MGIVLSLLLIAVGAVMRFAVTVQGHGFNVRTTGVILIIVGIVGAILSIVYWASWGGFANNRVSRRSTVAPVSSTTRTQAPVANRENAVVEEREV